MLPRSSSTPLLTSFLLSSSPPFPPFSSLGLRRAFSEGNLPSLYLNENEDIANPPPPNASLQTALSFSIYNTITNNNDNLTITHEHRDNQVQQQKEQQQQQYCQEDPELPLFLARGLGIDRIASGLFSAGSFKGGSFKKRAAAMESVGEEVLDLDREYKRKVDADPGNALILRNYAQFLHQVKGDTKRAEEYYSRAILGDPQNGEILSQYAKLVWDLHRDEERSLSYFKESVQAAPQNSYVLAAYANFLWQLDEDFEEGDQGNDQAQEHPAPGVSAQFEAVSYSTV